MIRLREATVADLPALFALDQLCFPAAIAYSLDEFRSLLRSRTAISVVAEEDGELAGFAIAQASHKRKSRGGHIITIDVAREFRRRGIGRLLMGHIEGSLRKDDREWIRLEVAADNSEALRFYEGLGFAAIGLIPDYYFFELDAVVMEKRLGAGASVNMA